MAIKPPPLNRPRPLGPPLQRAMQTSKIWLVFESSDGTYQWVEFFPREMSMNYSSGPLECKVSGTFKEGEFNAGPGPDDEPSIDLSRLPTPPEFEEQHDNAPPSY